MKLQDLKVVYICPDHDDKYRARKAHMDALLTRVGFPSERIEHFKSSTEDYPDCLSNAIIAILTKYMNEPVLILEDDVEFTGVEEFEFVADADAIYIGLSTSAGHPTKNSHQGSAQYTYYSASQVRIRNMLGGHAILYVSAAYKHAVIESFQAHIGQRYHTDVLMSRLHPHFLILANCRPSFYQSAAFNNTNHVESITKVAFLYKEAQ